MSSVLPTELSVLKDSYSLHARGRSLVISDISLAFRTPGSSQRYWVSLKDYRERVFSDGGFVFDNTTETPKVSVRARQDGDEFVSLQIKLYPKNSKPLGYEGCRIEMDYAGQGAGDNRQSYFSYFSFTFNGIMKERASPVRWTDGAPAVSKLQKIFYRERKGVAWWVTALKSCSGPASLFLGAESARVFKTAFSIHKSGTGHKVFIYQGLQGETLPLQDGDVLGGDPILISISDGVLATMRSYGARVAAQHRPVPHEPRRGWSSWYKYYSRISEKVILSEAQELKNRLGKQGFDLLQIDDGYQTAAGDWQSLKRGFRGGLASLAKKISAFGLKPGIWLAPFLVDVKSKTAGEAGEAWFLRDEKGRRLTYAIPKHSTNFILDVTHPEVQTWLKKQIATCCNCGFRYLKIDFLFLAASEARRFDPRISSMAAYTLGLKLIREAAGEDTTLLLSGSIDLGGIGLGNAHRMGPDIAYDIFSGHTRRAYIKAQMAATAAHFFLQHLWFTPNADAVLIRPPLKESLAEVMIAQVAMTGGDFILSDDLSTLPKLRLQKIFHPLLSRLTKTRGVLVPLDYFEHTSPFKIIPNPLMASRLYGVPAIWWRVDDEAHWLFFYNLSSKPLAFRRDLNVLCAEVFGRPLIQDGEWEGIFDARMLRVVQGRVDFTVPPDSVRIFRIKSVDSHSS